MLDCGLVLIGPRRTAELFPRDRVSCARERPSRNHPRSTVAMSTAAFEVTVLAVDVDSNSARLHVRCRPIASEGSRSVTRSFVIRMLAGDGWLAPGSSPPALARLVREAGLEPWPDTPDEARRLHAPVVDRLVTSTRLVAEHADDTYELEATLPDPRFVEGLHVGQTFQTYASDVWRDDPKHPLASDADRERWAAQQRATIASGRQEARADVER